MGYKETYQEMYRAIVMEHEAVFRKLDMKQLKTFMSAIMDAKRIFIHGTGREGISLRSFAMRLAHLGKPTYWLMDDTTISMGKGDLFIISDGRGDVGIHRRIVKQASKTGVTIAMLTALPEGNLAENYADLLLFIHATVYMADTANDPKALKQKDVIPTKQLMGNQYEQHLYLLLDIIVILLKDEMGLTRDDMEARHRNIE